LKRNFQKIYHLINTKFANNGKYAMIDQGIISLSNFSASILLTILVSPSELGSYVTGFFAVYFVRAIQDGLIIQPLNSFGASKDAKDFKSYFSAVAVHQLLLSILISIGAWALGLILTRMGNDTLGSIASVLWLAFFTWQTQEFFRRTFYTRNEVHKGMWISVVENLVRLGFIILISKTGQVSGLTGLTSMGLGSLVGTLLGIWFARDYFTKEIQNIYQTWQENWRFGRWILGASLAEWVVVDLYPMIIAGVISFTATGAYQTLQNLVAPIHVLLRTMDTFVTPILARTYDQSGTPKLRKTLNLIFLVGGIPVICLLVVTVILTPKLLYMLKGETYLSYANGIYLMALFYFFMFINRPLQMVFRAIRLGKQVFWANILATISMITIGVWLINRWGFYGAIGGQALNAIIVSLVLLVAWTQILRSQPREAVDA
jgi:O-antigen/teichoic acid export membrane protein